MANETTTAGSAPSDSGLKRAAYRNLLLQATTVGLFFAAWHLFSLSGFAVRAEMPGPGGSLARLWELLFTGDYWRALGTTVRSWATALAICVVVGIPCGLLIGRSRRAFDSTKFVIDFLRTIPSLAIVPLTLLLFGQTVTMVVVVCCLAAVWPLLIQSIYAGQHADPDLHRVARSFRLGWMDRIRYVLVPEALAFIWPGLRLAVTAALLVTIGAELVGSARGTLGYRLLEAQVLNQPDTLYAYVLTACALGLAVNGALTLIQRRLLWWHPSMRGRS